MTLIICRDQHGTSSPKPVHLRLVHAQKFRGGEGGKKKKAAAAEEGVGGAEGSRGIYLV